MNGVGSARAVLPVLLDVVRTVTARRELDLSELLKQTVAGVLPSDYFGGLVLGQGRTFSQLFLVPFVDLPSAHARDYFGHRVIETRQVIRFTRADLDAFPLHAQLWDRLGVHAALTIPLLAEARTLGTLSYWSKDVRCYDDADVEILAMLGRALGVAIDNHVAFERLEEARAQAAADYSSLVADVRGHQSGQDLIGQCDSFRAVREQVALVGPTGSTVLITGESGTGKELVARALHDAGPRREQPFVAINCAALPTSLAESELFGHEEGAFTGAIKRRRGRFELAQGGTLFLDEVGELPLETQAKLLRALQERRIERVGGQESLAVDVRIVAATNRDLAKMVAERRFREDLYYRLSVFPLYLPPLRERKDDIPLLVDFFIARAAERLRVPVRPLAAAGLARLVDYDWPGNVRELQNAIERAMIVSQGGKLDVEAVLPAPVLSARKQAPVASLPAPPAGDDRETDLKREYQLALDGCEWVIEGPAGAAARLGVHPNTLRYRLKRLGLVRPAR